MNPPILRVKLMIPHGLKWFKLTFSSMVLSVSIQWFGVIDSILVGIWRSGVLTTGLGQTPILPWVNFMYHDQGPLAKPHILYITF